MSMARSGVIASPSFATTTTHRAVKMFNTLAWVLQAAVDLITTFRLLAAADKIEGMEQNGAVRRV